MNIYHSLSQQSCWVIEKRSIFALIFRDRENSHGEKVLYEALQ